MTCSNKNSVRVRLLSEFFFSCLIFVFFQKTNIIELKFYSQTPFVYNPKLIKNTVFISITDFLSKLLIQFPKVDCFLKIS